MASLLKNQILKHLSKFTKNLSSDRINLSTLKGEGELSNLELNEDILTQLLELPTWLRITKAVCNRVAVKIQWTKLKSQPICLYLDEVIVETETCEVPRPPNSQNQHMSGGKYGFVDRVMDGIFVHVNSVVVKMTSRKFQASLQLSRVKVQSMSPTWQTPSDLRSTRIRDSARGEILLFKEIEWQTTRIEATAVESHEETLTPLRLIANQAKIRIAVKKRLSDSSIISSRLVLLLDDLLWVLTITQLKAAILYANSLKELIERSAKQSKTLAAEKLKKQGHMPDQNTQRQHQQQQRSAPSDRQESSTAKYFSRFDVSSTSYHLVTSRFDLHLCDDSSPDAEEKRHWKINGGSMQITFYKLSLDLYPFHPAGGERKSWYRYTDGIGTRNPWVQKLFSEFREDAVRLRKACESSSLPASSSAPSIMSRLQSSPHRGGTALKPGSSLSASTSPVHSANQQLTIGSRSPQVSPSHQVQRSTRLLESCFVFKVEDLTVYMVNTPNQRRTGQQKLMASDKKQLHLPPDMSMIHLEYTDYFFPEGLEYPVPSPNLYVLVNPVRITLDFLSLLWSNVFLLTLSESLDMDFANKEPSEHVDIKVELLMPRVVIPAEEKVDSQPDRPDALQLQVSKLVVSNCRTEERMTRDCLQGILDEYESARIFKQTEFPCEDTEPNEEAIPEVLYQHATDEDNPFVHQDVKHLLLQDPHGSYGEDLNQTLTVASPVSESAEHRLACDSLKKLASADIWSICAEQVWLEFLGSQNSRNRPVPFVEAVPVTIWISMSEKLKQRNTPAAMSAEKNQSFPPREKESHHSMKSNGFTSQQESSNPFSSSPPVMPTLGSSPPICDISPRGRSSSNNKQHPLNPNIPYPSESNFSKSNSVSHGHHYPPSSKSHQRYKDRDSSEPPEHHQHHPRSNHQQRLSEEDRRPSRLSISGDCSSGDGSRRSKSQSRGNSPFDEKGSLSRHGYQRDSHYSSDRQSQSPVIPRDSRARSHSGDPESRQYSNEKQQQQHHEGSHRRQKQFRREDSRSSSSPPLGIREMGGVGSRREESKERSERRGSQSGTRLIRQSSSSGSDRRDLEGYRSGDGSRDCEGRKSAEGQVSSDFRRSELERVRGDKKGSYEDVHRLYDHGRESSDFDRRATSDRNPRDVPGTGYRRRQSSSSSSELGSNPTHNPPGSKERPNSRSRSKDKRDRSYTLERQEMERRVPRDGSRDRERTSYERGDARTHGRGNSRSKEGEHHGGSAQDYDNDVGFGRLGGPRRTRDLQRMDGVSNNRSRESSLTRGRDRDQEMSRRRRNSSSHSDHQLDSASPSSSPRPGGIWMAGSQVNNFDPLADREKGEVGVRDEETGWRGSHQGQTSHKGQGCGGSRSNNNSNSSHCDDKDYHHGGPYSSPSNRDQQQQQDRGWSHHQARPTPEGGRSQEDNGPKSNGHDLCPQLVNKVCFLVSVEGKIRVQVSHFQYLFLMRLSESFAAFQVDLSADLLAKTAVVTASSSSIPTPHFGQSNLQGDTHHQHHNDYDHHHHHHPHHYENPPQQGSNLTSPNSTDIFIPLVLKEIELAVVCPYQMHQRTFSDDFSVISPFLMGLGTGQDAVFGEDGEGTCFPQLVDHGPGQRAKDDSHLQRVQQSISFKSNSSSQLENMSHLNPPVSSAFTGGGRGVLLNASSAAHQHPFSSPSHSSLRGDLPVFAHDSAHRRESSDTFSQSDSHSRGTERRSNHSSSRQHGGNASGRGSGASKGGASDMKKAFTSAFSNFTDKLKNKMEGLEDGYMGDDFDTMSIRTDTSDDDFEHLSLDDMEEVPAFFHDTPQPDPQQAEDSYSEAVDPGDSVSMYAESSTTKGKEMVYILLFQLEQTEVKAMLEDTATTACVQLAKLACVQLGNVSYDDFQSRFSSPKGYIQEELAKVPISSTASQPKPSSQCPIRLKYTVQAPNPDPHTPTPAPAPNQPPDPGNVAIQVDDFSLQFKMSGLTCLTDFIEDEKFPEVLPMTIAISNLLLVLEEDRPPANITSPGSLPLNLCIRQLSVERRKDGMVYLSGGGGSPPNPSGPSEAKQAFNKTPGKPANSAAATLTSAPDKPRLVNATTSPMPGLDGGTMALLMASQNEAVLLRRQLEEVRRANRLYEHQILQWREMQDSVAAAAGGSSSSTSSAAANTRLGFGVTRARPGYNSSTSTSTTTTAADPLPFHLLAGSQSSSGISEATTSAVSNSNHVPHHHHHHDSVDGLREEMEQENLLLQQRVVRLEDDLLTASKEKESLLQTLQLLQDELLASERKQRAKTN